MSLNILMIGQNDPAGMMIAFANAINRYTEHSARVISMRTVYSMDYEYDIELPRLENEDYSEVEHLLKHSDVLHFHMLMDEYHQLGPLQIMDYIKGKGLLYHHHGTYDHQIFLARAPQYEELYKRSGKRALVSTPDLLQLLPSATWQPNLVPINDVDYLPRGEHLASQDSLQIVQAPTRKWHKHTKEFIAATDRIMLRHPNVQRRVIEGQTYRGCLKIKRSSHVVFDHMNGWFGISSLESLAQGIPTIAGLDDWNISHIKEFTGAEELPWVVARDEKQLEYEIERLVVEPALRLDIGNASRKFMERHWTEQAAISSLIETYCSL
ncbi:MAG: hypothetical protein KDD42_09930 [Bdellovibrionales bacterium]|nr:hypothetical protein [Bdellovibrionales bacterium]